MLRDSSEDEDDLTNIKSIHLVDVSKHRHIDARVDSITSKVSLNLARSIVLVLSLIGAGWGLSSVWRGAISRSIISPCEGNWADCEATAPFIFDSIHSLTKQWPSTYAPNGHSIVTVVLPKGIPLYHTKRFMGEVKIPTWLSFDPCVRLNAFVYTCH